MKAHAWFVAAVVIGCLVTSIAPAAVPTIETFDSDTAGWTGNTTSAVVVHVAGGGNPNGHIQSRKDLSPPVFDIGALIDQADNPDFGGDYGAAGIRSATVDLRFMSGDMEAAWLRFRRGPAENGWRYPLTNVFPVDQWDTYGVSFDPLWSDIEAHDAGWVTDQDIDPGVDPSPSFADVLAAVDTAEVRIDTGAGSALVGIDNFGIQVPEPGTGLLLVLGAAVAIAFRHRRRL